MAAFPREWMNAHVDISILRRAGQRKSVPRYRVVWRLWFRDKWTSKVARDMKHQYLPWHSRSALKSCMWLRIPAPTSGIPGGRASGRERVQPTAPMSVWGASGFPPAPCVQAKAILTVHFISAFLNATQHAGLHFQTALISEGFSRCPLY